MKKILLTLIFMTSTASLSRGGVILFDDFETFNSSTWGDTYNVPLALGQPQSLVAGTDNSGGIGRSVLYMGSTLNDYQVRGIATRQTIDSSTPLSFDVQFAPQAGGIDGALQLWPTGDAPGKNLAVSVFGGNFGADRFVGSDVDVPMGGFLGSTPNFHASASGIWDYGKYYRYSVQAYTNSTHIEFRDDSGTVMWSSDYQVGLSDFGSKLHLDLTQFMYIPGRTSRAEVAIDSVTVNRVVPEPSSMVLSGSGLTFVIAFGRVRRRTALKGPLPTPRGAMRQQARRDPWSRLTSHLDPGLGSWHSRREASSPPASHPVPFTDYKGSADVPVTSETSSLRVEGGKVPVPTGPGFGIAIVPAFVREAVEVGAIEGWSGLASSRMLKTRRRDRVRERKTLRPISKVDLPFHA